jgi:hypothetical protein
LLLLAHGSASLSNVPVHRVCASGGRIARGISDVCAGESHRRLTTMGRDEAQRVTREDHPLAGVEEGVAKAFSPRR